ncbi:hypothetical protein GWI33_008244 [Rhynchophorus ferrugineus]|uniref:Microsomal glutathione S-transferase 1 n=1 Tax=Rhynchophorus ferrugineus TaxID=354439 RepID=A0A834ICV9_RHYFE|nr:hypothetical protein GWI33_008244 [Rhynchophorus ferrugineus]
MSQNPTIAVLKMMSLILLTIFYRMKTKVCISEEDSTINGATVGSHPDVERVRRAFQNDLETIPAFMIMSFFYLWVPVPDWVVHVLYYLFLVSRTLHSFVYAVYVIRQPSRAICFLIAFLILIYISVHVAIYGFIAGYLRV